MVRRHVLAAALVVGICRPAVAWAEITSPKFDAVLAAAPPYLAVAAGVWSAFWLAHLVWRLWRCRDNAAICPWTTALIHLFWATLPWLWLCQATDAETLRAKFQTLPVAAVWLALAIPALVLTPRSRAARLARWISLGAGDAVAAVWLIQAGLAGGQALSVVSLALFAVALHAAALLPKFGRTAPRVLGLAGVLWLTAGFFLPPAAILDDISLAAGPVRRLAAEIGAVRHALIDASGQAAFVVTEAEPERLVRIDLNTGARRDALALPGPILALGMAADRRTLAAAVDHPQTPLFLLDPDLLAVLQSFSGSLPFAARALVVTDDRLAVGGTGAEQNLALCSFVHEKKSDAQPLADSCREIYLPIGSVGSLAAVPARHLLFAAEGPTWLAEGWHVQVVGLVRGEILRRVQLGRSVGQTMYCGNDESLYTARPNLGLVEVRWGESTDVRGGYRVEPGVRFTALDFPRYWLLGTSPTTGRLVVVDLRTSARLADVPIGSGIAGLDYHRPTAVALLGTTRGLVVVNVLELSALKGKN